MSHFAARLAKLGFESYDAYLHSEHWRSVRRQYVESGRPKQCFVCGAGRYQLHHCTYRRLGAELLDDLLPLCGDCHERAHTLTGTKVDGKSVTIASAPYVLKDEPSPPRNQAKRQRQTKTHVLALARACPQCGAPAGMRCRTAGRKKRERPHSLRIPRLSVYVVRPLAAEAKSAPRPKPVKVPKPRHAALKKGEAKAQAKARNKAEAERRLRVELKAYGAALASAESSNQLEKRRKRLHSFAQTAGDQTVLTALRAYGK